MSEWRFYGRENRCDGIMATHKCEASRTSCGPSSMLREYASAWLRLRTLEHLCNPDKPHALRDLARRKNLLPGGQLDSAVHRNVDGIENVAFKPASAQSRGGKTAFRSRLSRIESEYKARGREYERDELSAPQRIRNCCRAADYWRGASIFTERSCGCLQGDRQQEVRRSHAQLRCKLAGVVRFWSGEDDARNRSEDGSRLYDRAGRLPGDLLPDGRPVRHAH